MKQLRTFIQAIPLALYSRDLYRQVLKKWKGLGILYILTLVAICLVPVAIKRSHDLDIFLYGSKGKTTEGREELQMIISKIVTQIPDITIENGIITTDLEQPVYINNPYTQEPLAIIDTSRKITSLEEQNATALITKDIVYVRGTTGDIHNITIKRLLQDLSLPIKTPINLNEKIRGQLQEFGLIVIEFGPHIMTLADWAMGSFAFAVRAILFAGLGIFFCSFYGKNIDFISLIRLAMVASTSVIICEMISIFLMKNIFAYKDVVYFLMHAAYMHHAIESNVKKS